MLNMVSHPNEMDTIPPRFLLESAERSIISATENIRHLREKNDPHLIVENYWYQAKAHLEVLLLKLRTLSEGDPRQESPRVIEAIEKFAQALNHYDPNADENLRLRAAWGGVAPDGVPGSSFISILLDRPDLAESLAFPGGQSNPIYVRAAANMGFFFPLFDEHILFMLLGREVEGEWQQHFSLFSKKKSTDLIAESFLTYRRIIQEACAGQTGEALASADHAAGLFTKRAKDRYFKTYDDLFHAGGPYNTVTVDFRLGAILHHLKLRPKAGSPAALHAWPDDVD